MLTKKQIFVKGTPIPNSDERVEWRCPHWDNTSPNDTGSVLRRLSLSDPITYGFVTFNEEEYVLIENKGYDGLKHYQIPLRELIRIGIVEVEGYRAPHDLYEGKVKKGAIYVKFAEVGYRPKGVNTYTLPKEIVERWEIVDMTQVTLSIGNPAKEVIINGDKITIKSPGRSDILTNVKELKELLKLFNTGKTFHFYEIKATEIQIGCDAEGTKVTVQDLQTIINAVNSNKQL